MQAAGRSSRQHHCRFGRRLRPEHAAALRHAGSAHPSTGEGCPTCTRQSGQGWVRHMERGGQKSAAMKLTAVPLLSLVTKVNFTCCIALMYCSKDRRNSACVAWCITALPGRAPLKKCGHTQCTQSSRLPRPGERHHEFSLACLKQQDGS